MVGQIPPVFCRTLSPFGAEALLTSKSTINKLLTWLSRARVPMTISCLWATGSLSPSHSLSLPLSLFAGCGLRKWKREIIDYWKFGISLFRLVAEFLSGFADNPSSLADSQTGLADCPFFQLPIHLVLMTVRLVLLTVRFSSWLSIWCCWQSDLSCWQSVFPAAYSSGVNDSQTGLADSLFSSWLSIWCCWQSDWSCLQSIFQLTIHLVLLTVRLVLLTVRFSSCLFIWC